MKTDERAKARELRERGFSINDIVKQIGVSKSSASTWTRDIQLTPEQRAALTEKNRIHGNQIKGAQAVSEKFRKLRRQAQAEGRTKAREKNWLHIAGCMLYWGEGRKERNFVSLINSDPHLLRFFIKFLHECFKIKGSNIAVRINCYTNNGLSQREIEEFWLHTLELPQSSLRKTTVNRRPKSSQQKAATQRKLLYGVCTLEIGNTHIAQHIYGAIQEYANFENKAWLD